MNQISSFENSPDKKACVEHLEPFLWSDDPACPLQQPEE